MNVSERISRFQYARLDRGLTEEGEDVFRLRITLDPGGIPRSLYVKPEDALAFAAELEAIAAILKVKTNMPRQEASEATRAA